MSTTTKIAKSSSLNAKQRERLETLFTQRFRKKPTPPMASTPGNDEIHDELVDAIKTFGTYKRVEAALKALRDDLAARYGVPNIAIGFSTEGNLTIKYDRYSSKSDDLVNTFRRERAAEIQAENDRVKALYAADQAAWDSERQEKITAIHTARSIEELLLIVPELRVNLPTEADLALSAQYTPMQITASSVVIDV